MKYPVTFRGKEFFVTTYGSLTPEWLLRSFTLENHIRDELWKVKPGNVVFDIGAAYGSYSLTALVMGASKVFAFDPDRNDLFDLITNVTCNTFKGTLIPINRMIAHEHDLVAAFYPFTHSTRQGGAMEERLTTTIDKVVDTYKVSRLDWVKIDVEGAEEMVVKGGVGAFRRFSPKILIENHVAFVPDVRAKIAEVLTPLGYEENHAYEAFGENSNEDWSVWKKPTKKKK